VDVVGGGPSSVVTGEEAPRWGGDDCRENRDFGAEKRDLGGERECYTFETFEELKARRSVPSGGGESSSAVIRLGAPGQTFGVGGEIFTGQRQEQQQQRPEVLPPELQHHHQPQVDGRDRGGGGYGSSFSVEEAVFFPPERSCSGGKI
ncbi:unnamed protein product, partial [Ectocarpus sp. 6 AP-2014]